MIKLGKKKDAAAEAAPAAEGAEGEDAPKKKKLPLLFIIIPAALVVLGGGAGAAFFLLQPKPAPVEAEDGEAGAEKKDDGHGDEKKKKGGDEKKKDDGHGGGDAEGAAATGVIAEGPDGVTFYTLPPMLVNIQSADGRPTFLKLRLTLEMSDSEAAYKLQSEYPRLNDMFQGFLRELRPEDLSGSAGTHQLRAEILRRVNLVAAPARADAVLIEEMLIQ
jgi:flagellar FliL protein